VDQCIEDIVIALVHMDEIWHIRVRSWYGFYTQREVAPIYVFYFPDLLLVNQSGKSLNGSAKLP
jgi:hypothetical protein